MSAGGSVADAVGDISLPPGSQDYSNTISRNLLEASRENIAIPPRNGQDGYGWTGNRVVSIPVPPGQNWVDWKNTHIMVTVATTGAVADRRRCAAAGAMSYVRRAVFRVQGGKDIEIRDSANLVTAIMAKFYSRDWLQGTGRRFGYGPDLDRQADALYVGPDTISGKRMELDMIALGIIESGRALPNYAVGYEFEFRLEDPLVAMVANAGSNPNYSWNNVQMYCELVTGTEFLDADIYEMWNNGIPYTVPFRETEYFPQALLPGEGLTQKNFSVAKNSVILYMMRLVLTSSASEQESDIMDLSVNPGINTVQLQIGGQLVPPSRISYTGGCTEGLAAMHNGVYRSEIPQSSVLDGDSFQANPPVSGVPSQTSQNMVVIGMGGGARADQDGGLNLNLGSSQAYLRLQLLAGLTLSCSMQQFVTYITHAEMFPNEVNVLS